MKVGDYNGYKVGAAKRKFKMGKDDFEPGTLITKLNTQKAEAKQMVNLPKNATERTAIMGAI